MNNLVIIGAGGHGREIAQLVKDINRHQQEWNLLGYVDDNESLKDKTLNGFPVLGGLSLLRNKEFKDVFLICAIGNSKIREKIMKKIENEFQVKYAILIHPTAVIGDETSIEPGTTICANCVITTNIKIGKHVLINYGCTVGHDTILEDYSTILPGCHLSGNVTVGYGADLGTGTSVIPGVKIGSFTVVGAGAVVINSLPSNVTAVGVPAIIKGSQKKGGVHYEKEKNISFSTTS